MYLKSSFVVTFSLLCQLRECKCLKEFRRWKGWFLALRRRDEGERAGEWIAVGVKSGIHFLDRIKNNIIAKFRKGGVILIRSTSNFSVPVPVGRYIIVRASSCGVPAPTTGTTTGGGQRRRRRLHAATATTEPSTVRSRISRPRAIHLRGPRVSICHRPRVGNKSVLGIFLTFIPRSVGTIDAAPFRTCLIGSDGCCVCCACSDTRKGS